MFFTGGERQKYDPNYREIDLNKFFKKEKAVVLKKSPDTFSRKMPS